MNLTCQLNDYSIRRSTNNLDRIFLIVAAALLITNGFSLNQEIVNAEMQETRKIGFQYKIGGLIDVKCTIVASMSNRDCFERFYGNRIRSLSTVLDQDY